MIVVSFALAAAANVIAWRSVDRGGRHVVLGLTLSGAALILAAAIVWWSTAVNLASALGAAVPVSVVSIVPWAIAAGVLRSHRSRRRIVLPLAAGASAGIFYLQIVAGLFAGTGVCLPPARFEAPIAGVSDAGCELGPS